MKLVHQDADNCCDWKFLMGGLPAGKNSEETQQKERMFLSSLPAGTPIKVLAGHGESIVTNTDRFSDDIVDIREQVVAIHLPRGVKFDTASYDEQVLRADSLKRQKRQLVQQAPA